MSDFRYYLDVSERFMTMSEHLTVDEKNALLSASTVYSWISIESFVNNMIDDFNQVPPSLFPLHEKAFLLEKKLRFIDRGADVGSFTIDQNQNDFRRLEEKIFFLIGKFSNADKIRGDALWQKFEKFKMKRNKIAHPRRSDDLEYDINETREFFEVAKDIISLISINVWNKPIEF